MRREDVLMANDVPASEKDAAPESPLPRRTLVSRRSAAILIVAVVLVCVGFVGVWITSGLRQSEPIPYSAPAGEQTGPPPAPNATWRKEKGTFVGVVSLSGGRTGFNDRELILGSGGPPPREASPESGCGQDIVVVVVEDTPDRIVVQGQTFAGRNEQRSLFDRTEWGCNAMRYQRTATVQLANPLAGRPVFDDGDAAIPLTIADGSRLLVPGWLPEGYQLHGETAGTLTYARGPVVGPSTEGGVGQAGLSVSQGPYLALVPRPAADQPPADVDEVLGTFLSAGRSVTVRGQVGVIVRDSPLLPTALIWHEGDEWLTISYRPEQRADERTPSDEDLLRIAESLRVTNT
jgi:hypothetical protein